MRGNPGTVAGTAGLYNRVSPGAAGNVIAGMPIFRRPPIKPGIREGGGSQCGRYSANLS